MKNLYLYASIAVAAVSVFFGVQNYINYQEKIERQETINRHIVDTRETWDALQSVRNSWEQTFQSAANVEDLFSLFEALDLSEANIQYETNQLIDAGRKNVEYNGMSIGLVNACVKTSGMGIKGTTQNIMAIIGEIQRIEKQKSVTFNQVQVSADEDSKTILFDDLCILMRGVDEF